jgi:alpha-tubulin suppressor-like RCC1 family protein
VVAGLPEIVELGVGHHAEHLCAIARDDAVWCWGNNDSGQLGDGTKVDRLVPGLVQLP